MGRILFFLLLVGTGWFALNVIGVSIDPRGVGTRVEGSAITLDSGEIEARYRMMGSLHEIYMLFGGDAQQRHNSITHVTAAGLPILNARAIAAVYPDFHLCKSPGAKQAQQHTQSLSFVAADRAALERLSEAIDLFEQRLGSGGERTCISVTGAPLSLESVKVAENGADLTREVAGTMRQTRLVLAQSVHIEDCQPLLR